ncbi:BrnA antitoxin family protein [Achromobacter animicus]|uniref:BrnA antitoxin family protein n=1 Tax=Achromobacter animicus TaxID=1389935 RepID=UPI003F69242D
MPKLKPGTMVPTPEEDQVINRGIAADPDTYELGSADLKQMKKIGRPKAEVTKERITIRLSPDVLTSAKQEGDGWQTRMDQKLRVVYKPLIAYIGGSMDGLQLHVAGFPQTAMVQYRNSEDFPTDPMRREEYVRKSISRKVGDREETRDFFVLKGMKASEAARLAKTRPLLWLDEELQVHEEDGVAVVHVDF